MPNPNIAPPLNTDERYMEDVRKRTGVDLPLLVNEEGRYLLRNGQVATIHHIDDPKKSTFNCKGSIHRVTASGRIRPMFNIWQPNGRFQALGEHPHDIIKKCKGID